MAVRAQITSLVDQSKRLLRHSVNSKTVTLYGRFGFSILISGIFLYLLLHNIDRRLLLQSLSRVSFFDIVIALVFLTIDYSLRVVRWWLMLREMDSSLTVKSCVWPYLVSIAINDVLPLRAGDAFRAFGFRKELQVPPFRIVGTLVIERVLDFIALVVLFSLISMRIPGGKIPGRLISSASWLAIVALLSITFAVLFPRQLIEFFRRILDISFPGKYGFNTRILGYLEHFLEPLRFLRSFRFALKMIVTTVGIWFFEGSVFITIARGVHALTSTMAPLLSMTLGTLGTLLPSSPGYFGTFDYFTMYGMLACGSDQNIATAFALIVHVVLWLPFVLMGFAYYFLSGLSAIPKITGDGL